MARTFKALAAGLLVVLTTSVTVGLPASAQTGGHLVSDAKDAHTFIEGQQSSVAEMTVPNGSISCTTTTFKGTITKATVTELTITPIYSQCYLNGDPTKIATINFDGCDYLFTFSPKPEGHNTTHINCPSGKKIKVTTPEGCQLTIAQQTPSGGVAYVTGTSFGKHDITAKLTLVGLHYTYVAGICKGLFGETGNSISFTGSVTLEGTETNLNPVNITAT